MVNNSFRLRKWSPPQCLLRWCAPGAAWMLLLLAAPHRNVFAQAAWEFSPYQVNVCLAVSSEVEFTPAFLDHARSVIHNRAGIVFFAAWDLESKVANSDVSGQVLWNWDLLNFDELKAGDASLVKGDKLYLVALTKETGEYLVRVRELDLRTRVMGPTLERRSAALAG